MKKRILLFIPCLLLLLGVLTACGSTESSEAVKDKLVNATWTTQVEDPDDFKGFSDDFKGLIDIDLPFDLGNLVTIKFDSDGTGYISIGEKLPVKVNFDWEVNGRQIDLKLRTGIGSRDLKMNFRLDENALRLNGTGININLNRR